MKMLGQLWQEYCLPCRLYCDDPKIRRVIVRHASMKEKQIYLCTDKTAYISLYTKDAAIVFEDSCQSGMWYGRL